MPLASKVVRRPRHYLPPEGIYHVTTRGVARTAIFLNDDEHRFFRRLFADLVWRHDWRVHAQGFNRRHKRWGHLFGERFAAWVVEGDEHYVNTCEYVLQNPVRAGLVRQAADWPWSAASPAFRTLVRVHPPG